MSSGWPVAAPRWSKKTRLLTALVTLLLVGGAVALLGLFHGRLALHDPRLSNALQGGLMAAAATALGTLPVAISQRFSQRANDAMLGFGAGVMLAATSFSLIIPALQVARDEGLGAWGSALTVGVGLLLGAGLLLTGDRLLPHEHFIKGLEGPAARALRRAWLFAFAITLHNMPEGLAVGVAFAGPDTVGAQALTTGIAIQDVPEGLVIALALRSVGYGRLLAVGLGIASGLVEPLFALLGAALMTLSVQLLPWGLAFAAGAMLFVISHEIIPESHRRGSELIATSGLMLGFVLMMVLDTALG